MKHLTRWISRTLTLVALHQLRRSGHVERVPGGWGLTRRGEWQARLGGGKSE